MENTTANPAKPLLIYDGDCQFCQYSVDYWHKLTADAVSYQPYQQVGAQFPEISTEQFRRAIKYVAPDGKIASGAEASFLTLNNAKGRSLGLTLYRKLPGFAPVSEWVYRRVASHRDFFYKISIALWGRHPEPPRFELVSWIFLRLLGLIFLAAFASWGTQALGLIGHQGIIPVTELVQAAASKLGAVRYWFFPMVFWLNASDFMVQAVCWGGAIISLLLVFDIWPRVCLVLLYLLYVSLCSAGQVFMNFQWDLFLLETGVLALFIVGSMRFLGIMLLRWLLFRFIFAAGLVKILSGDSTWHDFSALSYYFATEPLPTPLAWYANQLPQGMLHFMTGAALFVELVIPFLIFFPRYLRFFAGFAILSMQMLISISGNYNFFNLLTMLLVLPLFDDAALSYVLPQRLTAWVLAGMKTVSSTRLVTIFSSTVAIFLVFISVTQFAIRFRGQAPMPIMYLNGVIEPLRLVNLYGPFAVITQTRREIVVEGSQNGYEWKEYDFKYKPGDVMRRPRWNIPLQPRVDWQMWFAALGPPDASPWFYRFLERLLQGSPDVVGLLQHNPFMEKPPLYIKAAFYEYHFTTAAERKKTGAWWTREFVGDYIGRVQLRNP